MEIQNLPERVDRRRSFLVFLLASRGRSSPAASSAIIAATNQVAARAKVPPAAAAARTQHAGGTKRHGLAGVASGTQATEVVAADLAGGVVLRRCLVAIARIAASITTAHIGTATPVCLLAETLHLGLLLRASSLQ